MRASLLSARVGGIALAAATLLAFASTAAAAETTNAFSGVRVNGGSVTHTVENGRHILTLSDDFVPPETPDPHWQVVDSRGNTYLLQRLRIKEDGFNRTIVLPAYVTDVARVQMWCAFAQTLLGEASFAQPVATMGGGE